MTKYIPYIVIAVLLVSLVISLTNRNEVVIEKNTSDTVYAIKTDTYKVEKPIFITEAIVDTFLIKDSLNHEYIIPKTQKYYKDSIYEAWVSGYKPNLDSINIYNQTKFVTITNTTTKEIYPKTTAFYISLGGMYIGEQFAPKIGADFKFRNGMMIGANVGMYDKQVFYGLDFRFKLYGK